MKDHGPKEDGTAITGEMVEVADEAEAGYDVDEHISGRRPSGELFGSTSTALKRRTFRARGVATVWLASGARSRRIGALRLPAYGRCPGNRGHFMWALRSPVQRLPRR